MSGLTTIRPELLTLVDDQLKALTPLFWVLGGTFLALFFSVFRIFNSKWSVFFISLLTCFAGMAATVMEMGNEGVSIFNRMMVMDGYSHFFNLIYLACAALTILVSFRYLDQENLQFPEYNLLILFSAIGMMFLSASLDLIVLFVALEIMSLSVYCLVGFRRADRRSNEASMKYFILGGVASAILLYGVALVYGATGSTNIRDVLAFIQNQPNAAPTLFVLGACLMIIGFLFKIASVPFHMWMPDVYEGAPSPVTGFMTTGLKAASFAAFVRVFISMGYGRGLEATVQAYFHHVLWVLAVLTMLVGNVIALRQTNIKRMLGYSSIAHTGYLLVGVLAGAFSEQGYSPVVFYLVAYSAMNLGAFAILSMIGGASDSGSNLHDIAGLYKKHPWLAFSMAVFLLSMAGIPPTAGFAAKYLLFYSAVQAGEVVLTVLSVLCSAVSVYYYLRIIVAMYMRDPESSRFSHPVPIWAVASVAATVLVTLQLGIMPSDFISAARRAILGL